MPKNVLFLLKRI